MEDNRRTEERSVIGLGRSGELVLSACVEKSKIWGVFIPQYAIGG